MYNIPLKYNILTGILFNIKCSYNQPIITIILLLSIQLILLIKIVIIKLNL